MYMGSGADFTGVPTKMLNVNGSLRISVYNPATFYGIHVAATPVNLVYSDVVVATGEVRHLGTSSVSLHTLVVMLTCSTIFTVCDAAEEILSTPKKPQECGGAHRGNPSPLIRGCIESVS